MLVRTFELHREGSKTLSISQQDSEKLLIVSLNDRILGTLPPPEARSARRGFRLDDGSIITVWVSGDQIEVRHNGRSLVEAWSPAALRRQEVFRRDKMTRRIMLLCAILPFVLGIASLCALVIMALLLAAGAAVLSAVLCFDHCTGGSQPPLPLLSSGTLTMWLTLLSMGSVLLALIACAAGFSHALATERRRMAFVFGPLLLLEIVGLVLGVFSFSKVGFSHLFPIAFFMSFLVSVVCLVYAARLK